MSYVLYPFAAIVGQEKMKLALLLNAINSSIGGVLIKGEKGTAKSTAVRALAQILPKRRIVQACKYGCDPDKPWQFCEDCKGRCSDISLKAEWTEIKVVELPVSATEDRVVGTLDIEKAIKLGEKHFEPGVLAQANQNILYVDEINLLDDHVVDVLLDSAAMGVNTVEREGISYTHPAYFTLVGTMNPEEGDIRPQLLDRFGLSVEIVGEQETTQRVEVVKRRLAFEAEAEAFCKQYAKQQKVLQEQILKAKQLLEIVTISDELLAKVAEICITVGVDGHRSDITVVKTAMTIAAWRGRKVVIAEDILEACQLALPHRLRRKPFEEAVLDIEKVSQVLGL